MFVKFQEHETNNIVVGTEIGTEIVFDLK